MDAIQEYIKKPWVIGIIAFIVGLLIGLVVLGWGLWPVQYYDASPANLRADLQEDYLRMAIQSYAVTKDPAAAQARWRELGSAAEDTIKRLEAKNLVTPADESAFIAAATAGGAPVAGGTPGAKVTTAPGAATQAGPVTTPTSAPVLGGSLVRVLLPIMCLITLLLAAALVGAFLLRGRIRTPRAATTAGQAPEAGQPAEWTDYTARGEEPPMSQFVASYKIGDDMFDDSFSIDSPAGEFLGECGVGISETIGVGDPKKVTAFEVWLFDKNDIQTVTKVLMSTHAFSDENIRQRLAAKGEPVQAAPGTQLVLETATLQLVARVVDMAYGEGPLPPDSFFENAILELAVWQK